MIGCVYLAKVMNSSELGPIFWHAFRLVLQSCTPAYILVLVVYDGDDDGTPLYMSINDFFSVST